jgi:ssDNA-binding Zn-finger/Zn-ribbon topoisomerase 1
MNFVFYRFEESEVVWLNTLRVCPSCGAYMFWDIGRKLLVCSNQRECKYTEHINECPSCKGTEVTFYQSELVCLNCGALFLPKEKLEQMKSEEEAGLI